jgi:hypothetical protein
MIGRRRLLRPSFCRGAVAHLRQIDPSGIMAKNIFRHKTIISDKSLFRYFGRMSWLMLSKNGLIELNTEERECHDSDSKNY